MDELIQELEQLRSGCYWADLMLDNVLKIVYRYKSIHEDDGK